MGFTPNLSEMSKFVNVELAPPVAVFKLTADYKADQNPKKINLGVGAYRTDAGDPWVLPTVRKVEKQLAEDDTLNHEYLPIKGLPEFCSAACKLALGTNSVALQENLAADFLFNFFGGTETTIFYSKPTWGNHIDIYKRAGFTKLQPYSYWNDGLMAADVNQFIEDLKNAPNRSVILFHACAHNPTGADPSQDDWKKLADVCEQKEHFPIFDTAYQGFASGSPENDAWSLRYFVDRGFEMMVCQSFAKNFGLYNERAGNLITIVKDAETLERCRAQQELLVRANYSNPPAHGARIVSAILNTPELDTEWRENVKIMADRIILMRNELRSRLEKSGTPGNWNHITEQIGMFCFTGLNAAQVAWLKKEKAIYLMGNGRINMAALNSSNLDYFSSSVDEAVRNVA